MTKVSSLEVPKRVQSLVKHVQYVRAKHGTYVGRLIDVNEADLIEKDHVAFLYQKDNYEKWASLPQANVKLFPDDKIEIDRYEAMLQEKSISVAESHRENFLKRIKAEQEVKVGRLSKAAAATKAKGDKKKRKKAKSAAGRRSKKQKPSLRALTRLSHHNDEANPAAEEKQQRVSSPARGWRVPEAPPSPLPQRSPGPLAGPYSLPLPLPQQTPGTPAEGSMHARLLERARVRAEEIRRGRAVTGVAHGRFGGDSYNDTDSEDEVGIADASHDADDGWHSIRKIIDVTVARRIQKCNEEFSAIMREKEAFLQEQKRFISALLETMKEMNSQMTQMMNRRN